MTINHLTINLNRHPVGSRRARKWLNALTKATLQAERSSVPKAYRLNSAYHLPFSPALSRDERRELRADWRRQMMVA